MEQTIAIHRQTGSFGDRWVEYCEANGVPHRVVNCYDSDIISQFDGCSALLWHWHHADPKAVLFARQLIYSLEVMGMAVFPDSKTCWHFDDKVGQKYLLEAIGAPLVRSHVFYERDEALRWSEKTDYPKVFKLRGGAGSQNVKLVKSRSHCRALICQAFGRGFPVTTGYFSDFRTKNRNARKSGDLWGKLMRAPASIARIWRNNRIRGRDRGYAYFQDFVPENEHDIRITVIGDRAFGFRRQVRPGDFRASGSGSIDYTRDKIPSECLQVAFDTARKLQTQSTAFDFVIAAGGSPLIVEISYAYMPEAVHACPGHWDRGHVWHEGHVWPEHMILEDLLQRG